VRFLNDGADALAKQGSASHFLPQASKDEALARVSRATAVQRMAAWVLAVRYMSLPLLDRAAGFSQSELSLRYSWLMGLRKSHAPQAASILADQLSPFGASPFSHLALPEDLDAAPPPQDLDFTVEFAGTTPAFQAANLPFGLNDQSLQHDLFDCDEDPFGFGVLGLDGDALPSSSSPSGLVVGGVTAREVDVIPPPPAPLGPSLDLDLVSDLSLLGGPLAVPTFASSPDFEDPFGHGQMGFDDSGTGFVPAGAAAAAVPPPSHGLPADALGAALDALAARLDGYDALFAAVAATNTLASASLEDSEVAGLNHAADHSGQGSSRT